MKPSCYAARIDRLTEQKRKSCISKIARLAQELSNNRGLWQSAFEEKKEIPNPGFDT